MKKTLLLILSTGIALIFFGCDQNTQSLPAEAKSLKQVTTVKDKSEMAKNTLITFFDLLAQKEFEKALSLTDPDDSAFWETVKIYDQGAKNKAEMLKYYCEAVQTCLKAKVLKVKKVKVSEYILTTQFINKDGSIMKYGPFNGVDNDPTPPETEFKYTVKKIGGKYKVMTPPLYQP